MKTKSILFVVAALILLSFTFVSKQSQESVQPKQSAQATSSQSSSVGLAMEDQW